MPTSEGSKRKADVPTRALVLFLAATFTVTWSVTGFYVGAPSIAAALLAEIDGSHPVLFLATWSPAIAAIAVVSFQSGASGLRTFLSRLAVWRSSWGMLVAFDFQNEVPGRGGSIPPDFVNLKIWDWLPNGHATAFHSIGAMRRKHLDWFRADLARLFEMLSEGRLDPVVAEVLPLSQVREAHRRVESGEVAGKLVLRVGEP